MKVLIRWGALALAAASLSACVVYPAGHYRHDRYYGPPPPRHHYYEGRRPGWGAADAPTEQLASLDAPVVTSLPVPEAAPNHSFEVLAAAAPDTMR
ncbi:MAG: hypothetical protein ABI574_11415 [Burkholderiales bacterium]